jgi:hypothetical protein
MEALFLVAEHDRPTMFARMGMMRGLNPTVSLDVPRTESSFQKRATSFHEEQMEYPEKRDDSSPHKKHTGES